MPRSSSTAINTTPNSHMKIYYCLIFSFLYVLFFGGCESPKNLSTDYPSLEFKVDPNLLDYCQIDVRSCISITNIDRQGTLKHDKNENLTEN